MRRLAGDSPAGAPPEIGDMLAAKFRRYHARRRSVRSLAVAGLAACLVLSLLVLKKKTVEPTPAQMTALKTTAPQAAPKPDKTHVSGDSGVRAPRPAKPHRARVTPAAVRNASTQPQEFQALPAYDSTVRLEDTNVVRLELPGSALRLVGAPVSAAGEQRRVLADFVVGRDGTPYAVRLIAVRNTE
jgi:hypothetical protein